MLDSSIPILFVDTSSLRRAGFRSPDFQKLLLRSRDKSLRIVVSEVAWEEWRTHMRDKECAKVRNLRSQFEELRANAPSHRFLGRLPPPALAIWDDADIDSASKAAMTEHAAQNRIEIIPIGSDHGERTFRRYFGVKVEPPFNPAAKDRETRRKDIPDSWIFEVAVDLIAEGQPLAALCFDENLAAALVGIGVHVFREPAEYIAELERQSVPATETPALVEPETVPAAAPLSAALSDALDTYRDHERRVLGFVAHFGTPSKEQLWEFLARVGIPGGVAKNAADRLTLAGLIRDTGNHYLIADKRLEPLARASVEDDIIGLLNPELPNGL